MNAIQITTFTAALAMQAHAASTNSLAVLDSNARIIKYAYTEHGIVSVETNAITTFALSGFQPQDQYFNHAANRLYSANLDGWLFEIDIDELDTPPKRIFTGDALYSVWYDDALRIPVWNAFSQKNEPILRGWRDGGVMDLRNVDNVLFHGGFRYSRQFTNYANANISGLTFAVANVRQKMTTHPTVKYPWRCMGRSASYELLVSARNNVGIPITLDVLIANRISKTAVYYHIPEDMHETSCMTDAFFGRGRYAVRKDKNGGGIFNSKSYSGNWYFMTPEDGKLYTHNLGKYDYGREAIVYYAKGATAFVVKDGALYLFPFKEANAKLKLLVKLPADFEVAGVYPLNSTPQTPEMEK